ncbi:MAG: MerR family transcriptional regulator [Eubacteriales bacterium]|nr:MerR family transcriptional regulator [Eubacteriales bacterium]
MKDRFYIKEVADIMGVTRDTLRIYEEEGLIFPQRDANGFRVYSKDDIYRLIAIKFHKANDMSLKDIRNVLNRNEPRDIIALINNQIKTEESLIALHQNNLKRLKLAKYYYRETEQEISIEDGVMEGAYIVSDIYTDFMDTVKAFFKLSNDDPDYAMSFLNVEYDVNSSIETYKNSYVILDENEINALRRGDIKEKCEKLPEAKCIRCIVSSDEPVPKKEHLEEILKYAEKNKIKLTGRIYAHFLYQFEKESDINYIIEILAERMS